MSVRKYISIVSGVLNEITAITSGGSTGQAFEVVALTSDGKLNDNVMPDGVGSEYVSATANEALTANDLVNLFDDTGTLKARKASAVDNTKPAHGYVTAGVTLGNPATVYTDGFLPGSGLTKGSRYFLSASTGGGEVTATAPSATGNIMQMVGFAVGATSIKFEPQDYIVRA